MRDVVEFVDLIPRCLTRINNCSFILNREDAKSAKVFSFFLIRTDDQEKNHAFGIFLKRRTINPYPGGVQADCERRHPALTMSFLACFAS